MSRTRMHLLLLFLTFLLSCVWLDCANGRSLEEHRSRNFLRSEEAGRLRRGFQTSSLATARGFGKRAELNGAIPFISNPNRVHDAILHHQNTMRENIEPFWDRIVAANAERQDSYPINIVADLVASKPSLLMAILEQYVDSDSDGFISTDELDKVQ